MPAAARASGFTLIELMIVVAIIAVLATIAMSAYQDYVIRSQVGEGAVLGDGVKEAVSGYISSQGRMPTDNASAGLPQETSITGKFVQKARVGGGLITLTFSATSPQRASMAIDSQTLVFSPLFGATSGSIAWICQPSGTVQQKYLPTICKQSSN